ncbi:transcription repressor OFP8-like [Musa acuminata AAA Group]|uniref:transcription repressor OFP8-like n=1 Tax=Musa acuminata AAA Group TaxID=214697 RepID=UPI0031D32134
MSSRPRMLVMRQPVVVDVGCSCRRPKLPFLFSSSQKTTKPPKSPCLPYSSTTTSSWETSITVTTNTTAAAVSSSSSSSPSRYGDCTSSPSLAIDQPEILKKTTARGQRRTNKKKRNKRAAATPGRKRVVEGSVAVVKESLDPCMDFRNSMLQMIVEMEIYEWEDLRNLLYRFLALNAPGHHHLILRAFAEAWNLVFAPSSPSASTSTSTSTSTFSTRRRQRPNSLERDSWGEGEDES